MTLLSMFNSNIMSYAYAWYTLCIYLFYTDYVELLASPAADGRHGDVVPFMDDNENDADDEVEWEIEEEIDNGF